MEDSIIGSTPGFGPGGESSNLSPPAMLHDCNSTEPLKPSVAHYRWHKRNSTIPCVRSKAESALDAYWRNHATDEGFSYNENNRVEYDCATDKPYCISVEHLSWHKNNKTSPCKRSKIENSLYLYFVKYGTIEGHVYKARSYLEDKETKVYQVTFLDGDIYYGVTSGTLEDRLRKHAADTYNIGRKIRAGMPYYDEVLCIAPDRKTALELESLCIASGNPHGALLNAI